MGGDITGLVAGLNEGIGRDIFPVTGGGLRLGDIVALPTHPSLVLRYSEEISDHRE